MKYEVNIKKKVLIRSVKGFTLAETLITLIIIGVVAALTIPAIMVRVEKATLASQLKATVSLLNQALTKTNLSNGNVPYACSLYYDGAQQPQNCVYDTVAKKYNCFLADGTTPEPPNNRWNTSECGQFFTAFKKNLNIVKTCDPGQGVAEGCMPVYKSLEDVIKENNSSVSDDSVTQSVAGCGAWSTGTFNSSMNSFVLSNGVIIFYSTTVFPAMDINGMKGPNKWGYDLFTFTFWGSKAGGGVATKVAPDLRCIQAEPGGDDPSHILRTS